jgi:hypothetical protein
LFYPHSHTPARAQFSVATISYFSFSSGRQTRTVLAWSSTGTVFVRVNGCPSTADQVVRYLTSSTAAELHPTQCRKRSGAYSRRVHTQVFFARHGGDFAYLAYPTVAYSRVRGLRTNTYD